MDLLQILVALIIVGICGALAQLPTGFSTGGTIVSIIIGVIGAYLGMWVARRLAFALPFRIEIGSTTIDLLWCLLGAFVVVLLLEATQELVRVLLPQREG